MSTEQKPKRGFAAMSKEQRSGIAMLGGVLAHQDRPGKKRAHQFTSEEAKAAGRIGGLRLRQKEAQEKARATV